VCSKRPARRSSAYAYDIEDARRVKRALDLLYIPLVDYVIVGESITSLVHRRVI
jgi:DNA repair protein RadC